MNGYDVIFFDCGIDTHFRDDAALVDTLQQFVQDGGSLYASDLAFPVVEAPFPAKIDFQGNDASDFAPGVGARGEVDADVLDPVMQQVLGSNTALVEFNLGGWAAMVSTTGDTLLEGSYPQMGGGRDAGPLAVRFTAGSGTVVYTSFHNEQQINFDMATLLQEMVLSL
ncbi:MAG: hypothetical protein R3F59_24195 [Myxococcota bacterium]